MKLPAATLVSLSLPASASARPNQAAQDSQTIRIARRPAALAAGQGPADRQK